MKTVKMEIPKILKNISNRLNNLDARAIIVGGSVRDFFLQHSAKDIDVEVYGIDSLESLEKILSEFGIVNIVGKSFGVLKLKVEDIEFDFSLPRVEKKVGVGHKGFEVEVDAKLTYKEAFRRRDFTINAIGYDIKNKKFIDEYDGIADIKRKILREVDANTFIEDSLRVYRAIQFVARFEFSLSDSLEKLCIDIVKTKQLEELPKERVFEEFKKLLLKADKPSLGFYLMKDLGILQSYFPELYDLIGLEQDMIFHPEGDVFTHTMLSIDALKEKDLVLKLAVLCHDMGKISCTKVIDGRIRSRGHEEVGVQIAEGFLKRLTDDKKLIQKVLVLVRYHFAPTAFYKGGAKSGAIRRLATKVNIEELVKVAKADFLGRGDDTKDYIAGEWLLKKAKSLNVKNKPIKALVRGKDLIELGLQPSPEFKKILDKLYEIQIERGIESKEELLKFWRD